MRIALVGLAALLATPALAQHPSLSTVKTDQRTINCLFSESCAQIDPIEQAKAEIRMPNASGGVFLHSRAFAAGPGSPAAGHVGYEYQVDLKDGMPLGDFACIERLDVDFGPIAALEYDRRLAPGQTYEITGDAAANEVGIGPATEEGGVITFRFDRPLCTSDPPGNGAKSFVFGVASRNRPRAIRAQVSGAGLDETVAVKAFAPDP